MGVAPATVAPAGDYSRFGKLLHERFGLHFSERRQCELERAVQHAFATSTAGNLEEYLCRLEDYDTGSAELDELVNAATISETHFFRDEGQFDALYYRVLPELIARRRSHRFIRLWSAGCASGEEAYSLAMLLRELLPHVDEWVITILATDINTQALERARRAVYSDWAFRETRARDWRERYFLPAGQRYELVPEVRRMVTFARLNLAAPSYPSYDNNTTMFDLILCRNVLIYFDEAVAAGVVDRFYHSLGDGGWLVLGHAEATPDILHRFRRQGSPYPSFYQRLDNLPVSPLPGRVAGHDPAFTPGGGTPSCISVPTLTTTCARAPVEQPTVPPPANAVVTSRLPAEPMDLERAREGIEYGHAADVRAQLESRARIGRLSGAEYTVLGQACASLADWPGAEHWCTEALRADHLAREAYYTLGLVLQHRGHLSEATNALRRVVYLDPIDVLGHFGLAQLYHAQGRQALALKSLENARRLLEARPPESIVPGSEGMTTAHLCEAVVRQQEQWRQEKDGKDNRHGPER